MIIYIYIYHHHHVVSSAQISQTFSLHLSLSSIVPAGIPGYIPYRQRATVCRFKLVVLPLLGHVKGSSGVHHL